MARIIGNRMTGRWTVACNGCGRNTTTTYAKQHAGQCKACTEVKDYVQAVQNQETRAMDRIASREEQHSRFIDCGPAAWDDR